MVYGFDNAKNKYEVYTKNDFAVITGTVTSNENSNKQGHVFVDLPNGFTIQNTMIVNVIYSYSSEFFGANLPGNFVNTTILGSIGTSELYVQLGDVLSEAVDPNKVIAVYFYPTSIAGSPQTVHFKVLLMKTDSEVEG